jgi:hypothetical protein
VLFAKAARAEPIQITSGRLQLNGPSGTLSLAGTRGFSLTATVSASAGVFAPWLTCHLVPSCLPGDPINLEAAFVGVGLISTVQLDGRTYVNVGSLISDESIEARFTGTALAPRLTELPTQVSAPFGFEGRFVLPDRIETLAGTGSATLFLRPHAEGAAAWDYVGADYSFTPTPEPATLVLFTSGLVTLVGRRIRQRRR